MSARGSGTPQNRAGSGDAGPSVDVSPGNGPAAGPAAYGPALLQTVLNLTPAWITYTGRDGRFRFVSPALARAMGASADHVEGITAEELGIPAAHREPMDVHVATVLETGRPLRVVIAGDGGEGSFDVEVALDPDLAPDGTVNGVVITAWDVTELRRAVQRIAHLDRVYVILSDINQAIVRIRDRDQILVEMRPSLRVVLMSGYGGGLGPMPADLKFHFIAKPFAREALTSLVAKVLSES